MIKGESLQYMLRNINYALESLTALKFVIERDNMIAPSYFEEKFSVVEEEVEAIRRELNEYRREG